MMPRLQAEEQLAAIDATALGGGKYPKEDARSMLRRLHDMIRTRKRAKARPSDAGQLAAMGIGVTIVEPGAPGDV